MTRLLALTLTLALAALVAAPAGGASHVRLAGCGEKSFYKPKRVTVRCGDGSLRAVKLEWPTWTRKKALGRGIAKVLDCETNCSDGPNKSYKVRLKLSRPTDCGDGGRQFLRITYTFPDTKPEGPRTKSYERPCNGNG
jgi:ribosomal protein L37E